MKNLTWYQSIRIFIETIKVFYVKFRLEFSYILKYFKDLIGSRQSNWNQKLLVIFTFVKRD